MRYAVAILVDKPKDGLGIRIPFLSAGAQCAGSRWSTLCINPNGDDCCSECE